MTRNAMMAKVLEMKRKALDKGAKPTVLALGAFDLLKLRCTHLHGMQLVKYPQLKHGQAMLLQPDEQGNLKPVKP